MSDETTRLRALLEQTEMPWRAVDVVDGGTVLGRGTAILRPHSRWLVRRVAEMLRLSSFPANYPLCGTRRERTMLVGNSVPPLLARHVVASVMEGAA